ncbi:hypothetical protein FOA52_007926 [Chlamydomonas sp. UWO 241]|nr:hypothetical protein FOA52_007926 [Chlamydomonas sp. UWO 241]
MSPVSDDDEPYVPYEPEPEPFVEPAPNPEPEPMPEPEPLPELVEHIPEPPMPPAAEPSDGSLSSHESDKEAAVAAAEAGPALSAEAPPAEGSDDDPAPEPEAAPGAATPEPEEADGSAPGEAEGEAEGEGETEAEPDGESEPEAESELEAEAKAAGKAKAAGHAKAAGQATAEEATPAAAAEAKRKLVDSLSVRKHQDSSAKAKGEARTPRGVSAVGELEHMSCRAPSPSKRKSDGPWLKGTYTTPTGRTLTGAELCTSLDRMYTAGFKDRPLSGASKPAPGDGPKVKIVSGEELDGIVSRLGSARPKNEAKGKIPCKQLGYKANQEVWEPVQKKSETENTEYLCTLYTRCLASKKEADAKLAAKWLKPLGGSSRPSTAK